jgi:hypothetical protein
VVDKQALVVMFEKDALLSYKYSGLIPGEICDFSGAKYYQILLKRELRLDQEESGEAGA